MANIGSGSALSQTASNGTQKIKPQSNYTVDAVEPQGVVTVDVVVIVDVDVDVDVEADRVRKLAKERKLAEKYLMSQLCSSRDVAFMALCDDQSRMPFRCG